MSPSNLTVVAIAGALIGLPLLVLALRRRARVLKWLQALFRRPPQAARSPGPKHYYKPYWS
jgi:hypothetical protein